MTTFKKQRISALIMIVVIFLLDFISKKMALENLSTESIQPVIDGLFNLRLAFNTGVSFSMFSNMPHDFMPYLLGTVSLVASAGFIFWLFVNKSGWLFAMALSLIIGGALGNGFDRFYYGAVVDFIDIYYDTYHWPTFNVADMGICLGVALLILESFLVKEDA